MTLGLGELCGGWVGGRVNTCTGGGLGFSVVDQVARARLDARPGDVARAGREVGLTRGRARGDGERESGGGRQG